MDRHVGWRRIGKSEVHQRDVASEPRRVPHLVIAQRAPRGNIEIVHDDLTSQPVVGSPPEEHPVRQLLFHLALHRCTIVTQFRAVAQISPTGRQDDEIRLETIELRLRINQLLPIDFVVRLVNLRTDPAGTEVEFDQRIELMCCAAPQYRDPGLAIVESLRETCCIIR